MKFQHFWPQKAVRILISIEKNMDINLMILNLIYHQNLNFLATHVDAKNLKCWYFFCIFGRKQPMRRELANSISENYN